MAGEEISNVSVQEPANPGLVEGVAHENPVVTSDAAGNEQEAAVLATKFQHLSLSAQTIHADDYLNSHQSVAPPMHVSTTFRYNDDPDKLNPWANINPNNPYDSHVYSRDSAPNTSRLEAVLTSILHGPSLTYSSGLSSFHALLVYLNPRRVAIAGGYHGCHGVIQVLTKLTGLQTLSLFDKDLESKIQPGDVVHVETPLNPTGEARSLKYFADIAHKRGAYLTVDATFAPPPLQDPFLFGADVIMHSGTKYFGGHSDMLCGVLAVNPKHATGEKNWIKGLREERLVLGSVMGSFEGWLGVRSLRTLEVRVRKQSVDAEKLVRWLASQAEKDGTLVNEAVAEIKHASLQKKDLEEGWLKEQMPNGFGPVFAVYLRDADEARRLPSKLALFHHATSLGGVESLVEWRAMTDAGVDKRLLRFSIGLEGFEDLRDDLIKGFEALKKERKAKENAGGGANIIGGA
ncbi:cystathionine gamma-synthase [Hypoxylon trugodes]|uniref:cystathionine gamma-synthase n=1 Tax=Hypoxylon trugodes TaxID=326681 RepID=UPI002197FD61|nr:cystathionine gamma-synthase [Hypoxylon trugodes]KAI1383347.1 cystathionine gamma-synthase [Hypoxylon trugodes]